MHKGPPRIKMKESKEGKLDQKAVVTTKGEALG